MQIQQLSVRNFRLLRAVELALTDGATVIVGRNNSGKTSLSEIFRRLATDRAPKFSLEDFSSECYDEFIKSIVDLWAGVGDAEVRRKMPAIQLRITFSYGPPDYPGSDGGDNKDVDQSDSADLGPLSYLIIDLDPECTTAVLVIEFRLEDGALDGLIQELTIPSTSYEAAEKEILDHLRRVVPRLYKRICWAEDPNDASNRRTVDWPIVERILVADFVTAQRGLDDDTVKDNDSLAKIFESLFLTSRAGGPSIDRTEVAKALQDAVSAIEKDLDNEIKEKLNELVPSMELMGYPGLDGLTLFTETKLEVARLLSDNTRVRYAGHAGVPLPESYNGLGARNLILILLRLVSYYRKFAANTNTPSFQLVFIEEPEVHLHPQMQEVFIRQLDRLARSIAVQDGSPTAWPVQFVVSTHSSHIANEAPFTSIRYFLCKSDPESGIRTTAIKDLSKGLGGVSAEDIKFIHQYLTLTKCDLFFADKVVLIEGTTERLLLPKMIEKMQVTGLNSHYLSLLEVGGAFAHKFFALLDFLELAALIITDIDSVGDDKKACAVGIASTTSNACIRQWFEDSSVSISMLLGAAATDKEQPLRRLAYQIPEVAGGACGRSFEDAFMLANTSIFGLDKTDATELGQAAYAAAKDVKKAEFALRFATVEPEWNTPLYIKQGLDWLLGVGAELACVDPGDVVQPVSDGNV